MAKIYRFKSKQLRKETSLQVSDNKENEHIYKSKETLGNFILKELENSVSELSKSQYKNKSSSILNPYAKEFTITNS